MKARPSSATSPHGRAAGTAAAATRSSRARIAAAAVFAVVLSVFLRTIGNSFVDWDDTDNFLRNPSYRGLGAGELRWMFTTFHMGHYQPLSWLTLGWDYTLSKALFGDGMDPRIYHCTNALLHALNAALFTLISFLLLSRSKVTSRASPTALALAAAFAGLLFGVHPLRVESVAWVTERRDLLSTGFFLLSLLAYLSWTTGKGRRTHRAYALAFALFVLGLLSKVSVVVLPVVLLVLDVYPLERLRAEGWKRILGEKVPFLVMSMLFGLIASFGQARHQWLYTLEQHPMPARIAQSFYGLAFYVWKTLLPFNLLPIYEMHLPVNPFQPRFVTAAVAVVVAVAALIRWRRNVPALAAAGAVYVAVLAPVIGIAQNGPQEVADRYSYVSMLGWALVAAGGGLLLAMRKPALARPLAVVGVLVISGLAFLTARQCGVWRSTETLWTYTAAHAPNGSYAQNGYGYVLLEQGRPREAVPVLRRAVAIQPSNEKAHHNLWRALKESGDEEALIAAYRESIRLQADPAAAHYNLGNALVRRGDLPGAIESYRAAIQLQPENATHHGALALALGKSGDQTGAEAENRRALALDPNLVPAHYGLALALEAQGRTAEAIEELRATLRLKPDLAEARRKLEQLTAGSSPGP